MSKRPEDLSQAQLEKWKGKVFEQTQGVVDVDRDHPNLGLKWQE